VDFNIRILLVKVHE